MIHLLEFDGICLEFGLRKILSDIYIQLQTGKVTGILGRNGQGKTCLMNIVHGSMKSTSRSVRLDGKPLDSSAYKKNVISYLPQFSFIPASFTIQRICEDYEVDFDMFTGFFPTFTGRLHTRMAALSGGERRLLEVYTIIKSKSKFILLDEPFSHIMPLHIETIIDIINTEKANKGFLITDHVYRQIIAISDSMYVLNDCKAHPVKDINDIERLGYVRFS